MKELNFFQGFFLNTNVKAAQRLARIAFERKRQFLFNMCATYIYKYNMDAVMSIFRYITIIVGNDEVSCIRQDIFLFNKQFYL